jgi:hypothetical protein
MRLNFKKPTSFQEQRIPEASKLAGFAALVNALSIEAPCQSFPKFRSIFFVFEATMSSITTRTI